jgi:hypothetical protein
VRQVNRTGAACALSLILAAAGARAQTAPPKPAEEISGCLDRAKVEKYIADHNFAELLRGTSSDGKTHGVWTSGTQVLIIAYARPPEDRMDQLKTICVMGLASKVSFNLYVIEQLVSSATGSLGKK